MNSNAPFWQTTALADMSDAQWESLCDGCGKCCLHKLEDENTGEVYFTRVACTLLDIKSGRCKDYENRFQKVADCLDLRAMTPEEYRWLPATCAYRLIADGEDLPDWHHLISGRTALVHKARCSVRGRAIPESKVDLNDLEDQIVRWVDV